MEKYAWLAVLTLVQIVQFLIIKRNGRGYKYNPHQPGDAVTCRKHGEDIAGIKKDIENIKEDIREIKGVK